MTTATKSMPMHRRVNVTLPEDTLELLDRVAEKGDRSAFLDRAVHYYVRTVGTEILKKELRRGASARAARDSALAEEWFKVNTDVWPKKTKPTR